jgi:hypothetical protein
MAMGARVLNYMPSKRVEKRCEKNKMNGCKVSNEKKIIYAKFNGNGYIFIIFFCHPEVGRDNAVLLLFFFFFLGWDLLLCPNMLLPFPLLTSDRLFIWICEFREMLMLEFMVIVEPLPFSWYPTENED